MSDEEVTKRQKWYSIASMILGVISLIGVCTCVGPICGVFGIVFGAVALHNNEEQQGMAIAGIVLCAISLSIWVAVALFSASLAGAIASR